LRTKAAWRHPALGPPRLLETSGGPLQYFDVGAGAPIVFVHGAFVNANLWRKVVPVLARGYRCVVLDLPFGSHTVPMNPNADLSEQGLIDLITDTLEMLELRDVTLVGMDTGGAICQYLVTRRPERIARLVLTSCDYRDNFPPRIFFHLKLMPSMPDWLIRALFSPFRIRAVRRLPNAFGWLSQRAVERAVEDTWVLPALEDRGIQRDVKKMLRIFDKRRLNEAADRLHTFDKPALIAWSRDDRVFPARDAQRLANDLPNARLTLIDDARTFSMEDQPDRLAALIDDFLTSTTPAPRATPPRGHRAGPPAPVRPPR
jgi:pimeloyl-ACP methyl ester carboxylesterase